MLKIICLVLSVIVLEVTGHGMMLQPPNRSSIWRFDPTYPPNYNDNENFCGGREVQWAQNGGKCGVCGDNYSDAHPQSNENTGTYGLGKIVANYTAGEVIETRALLTANHLGHFYFSLCELEDANAIESGEDCFKPLYFADGTLENEIFKDDKQVFNFVQLPANYTCERCVLRWHYQGGNNWGQCDDGSWGLGCGIQENFRSCADISIHN